MTNTTTAIAVNGLRFGYQPRQPILHDLHLHVPRGAIYGFLGANGAGKSTTIRQLLGLLRPDRGAIRLFGEALPGHRRSVSARVGSLIETPSYYQHLSGYDNLRIAARYQPVPAPRIREVLQLVGLGAQAFYKPTRHYSTGMKQRLGLAMALLHDPELLILDEPTNGLDPSGIVEIRETLLHLHAAGKTIFLSSHLLSEVARIATRVGILHEGRLLFEGSIAELEAQRSGPLRLHIGTDDAQRALLLLQDRYPTRVLDAQSLEVRLPDRRHQARLSRDMAEAGLTVYELKVEKDELEQLFIDLTTAKKTTT